MAAVTQIASIAATRLASRLLGQNPPLDTGIVPGSVRTDRKFVQGVVGARLGPGATFDMVVQELNADRALLGSQTNLVMRVSASLANGDPITAGNDIALREEAPTLLWRSLELKINGMPANPCDRSDIIRNTIDRTFTSTNRGQSASSQGDGPYSYRHINHDSTLLVNSVTTDPFKFDDIHDNNEFELVRPLTDLPFMGDNDGVVPGIFPMTLRATTTTLPENLFASSTPAAVVGNPFLTIKELYLETRTIQVEPAISAVWQQLASDNTLEFNTNTWVAQQGTPIIAADVPSYDSSQNFVFSTVPDVMVIKMFQTVGFSPSVPVFEQPHPLLHVWNGLRRIEIKRGGECIRIWDNLDKSRQSLARAVAEAIETTAGAHIGTLGPRDLGTVFSSQFVADTGAGAIVQAFRNWGEEFTHNLAPLSVQLKLDFVPTTAVSSQLFVISKQRHRWTLSLTSGQTRQLA